MHYNIRIIMIIFIHQRNVLVLKSDTVLIIYYILNSNGGVKKLLGIPGTSLRNSEDNSSSSVALAVGIVGSVIQKN
jgi:hypothetical protein